MNRGATDRRRAVIYARFSTDRQDPRSIDDQLRRCRAFAKERGYEIVEEYSDLAATGANLNRDGMQRLLRAARSRGRPFRAVLVDDLSRLSRDLGDTWRLVFEDLAAVDVTVIDCTTGMASDGDGARLTFGAMALVNDTFLQLVRTETHRGLEGRALRGFHTGGRCFGYTTEPEVHPEDPERPRAVLKVNLEEAKIVQRVFGLYADGVDLASIVGALNSEGIPAPYDRLGYGKRATGKGWAKNQVSSMLRNERYAGKIIWNKRKWFKDPVSKRRRARMRPESEWVVREEPALAIVTPELWARVQARRGQGNGKPGRPAGQSTMRLAHPHLLTGLLKCGACGGSMSIVGSRTKNGVTYKTFGCSTKHNKGSAACANGKTISEKRINETLIEGIIDYVGSQRFRQWVEEAAQTQQAARERARQGQSEVKALEAEIRAQAARVDKVAEAVATVGLSDALTAKLRTEEDRLRALRQQMAAVMAAKRSEALPPVDVGAVIRVLRNIERMARERPLEARRALQEVVEKVVLTPRRRGSRTLYEAEVTLRNDSAALSGGRVSDKTGCGGRI